MDVVEEDMERFEGEDVREMVHCGDYSPSVPWLSQ